MEGGGTLSVELLFQHRSPLLSIRMEETDCPLWIDWIMFLAESSWNLAS